MIQRFSVETTARSQMIDITALVMEAVAACGLSNGLCFLHLLHTTAGLTINENADPNVMTDLLGGLSSIAPPDAPYQHLEGNSDAHIKASLVGFSQSLIVDQGNLVLGTWQGIYLCEFDGPRRRQVVVKVISDS